MTPEQEDILVAQTKIAEEMFAVTADVVGVSAPIAAVAAIAFGVKLLKLEKVPDETILEVAGEAVRIYHVTPEVRKKDDEIQAQIEVARLEKMMGTGTIQYKMG